MQWYTSTGVRCRVSGDLRTSLTPRYLLAAVINLGVVPKSPYTWRSLYFIGAGFSLAAAIFRACLPESKQYLQARKEAREAGYTTSQASKNFIREVGIMFKTNCKFA